MGIFDGNNRSTSGVFGSGGAGASLQFGSSTTDLSSSQGLLELARMRGGAVGEIAEELTHHNRSILSTVGDGFKNAFKGFVDIISMPSQVIAGAISSEKTIGQAIDEDVSVSDVLFGEKDPNATTMQKVGSFVVRTAVDILTDPLTYVTFGAGSGIAGLRSTSKITLGAKGAAEIGEDASKVVSKALSDEGQEVFKYLKAVERQQKGTLGAEKVAALKGTGEVFDLGEKELKKLLNETLDAPLNPDFAKKALANIIENNPALTSTLLDKGGIKFFGNSILDGQRIASVVEMIPGFKLVDTFTQPVRNAVGALFDPAVVKVNGSYVRLPEEYVNLRQGLKDISEASGIDFYSKLQNVQKANNLTTTELEMLSSALAIRKMPADKRLANAYLQVLDINEEQLKMMRKAGIPVATLENHVGNVLLPNEIDPRKIPFNSTLSSKVGAAQTAGGVKFVAQEGQNIADQITAEVLKLDGGKELSAKLLSQKSTQDVGFIIGNELDKTVHKLVESGMKFEDAFNDSKVKKLIELRDAVDSMPQSKQLVGSAEDLKLTGKVTAEEVERISKEAEAAITAKKLKVGDINKSLQELVMRANEYFKGKVSGQFEQILKNIPVKDRENVKQFLNVIENEVGALDIEKIALKQSDKTKKAVGDLSEEAFEVLKAQIKSGEKALPGDIEEVNKFLKEFKPTKKAKDMKGGVEGELKELAEKLKFQSEVKRFSDINKSIDRESLAKIMKTLQTQFSANPEGIKNILSSFLEKKKDMIDLLSEIDLERTIAKQNISELPEVERFFTDESGTVYKRVAASAQELKEAGFANFDTNVLTAQAVRGINNINQSMGRYFMSSLARNFGKWSDEAPAGWVRIGSAGVNNEAAKLASGLVGEGGKEMFFHPAIAKDVENFIKAFTGDEATSDFLKYYDKIQQYWKASVTSIFPAFHGRNAISNVFLNFLDLGVQAINPATHGISMDLIRKDRTFNSLMAKAAGTGEEALKAKDEVAELLQTKVFTDATGYEYTFGELRTAIKERGVAFNPNVTGALDIRNSREDMLEFFNLTGKSKARQAFEKSLPVTTQFAGFKAGREVGRVIEEQARLVNFLSNLRKTGDVNHAAQRTKQFLFDYGNLTSFEKSFMRRIIPFYAFTRFNLELQAKTLLTTPGRISAQIKAFDTLGDVLSGGDLSEEDRKNLPAWVQQGINILKGKKGSTVEIYSSLGTPIEQPFAAFKPNALLGSISPLLRVPLEQATGYSFFHGKLFSDVTNAAAFKSAPDAIKEYIGFTEIKGKRKDGTDFVWYEALRPERMNLLMNLPGAGRVMSSLRQMQDADTATQSKILQQLIGLKAYSFDLEKEAAKREKETVRQLEDLLTSAGITAQFTKTYLKKE